MRINREDLSWRHLLITAVQTQSLCCITLSGMMDPLKLTCSQQLWLHSSVGRALHQYRRGHGFESRWSLNFFQASLSQLLKLRINRKDLSWRHLLITAVQTQSPNSNILTNILKEIHLYFTILKTLAYSERNNFSVLRLFKDSCGPPRTVMAIVLSRSIYVSRAIRCRKANK